MNVFRTKTFRAGNSDAVRLPKEISSGPDVEVEITRSGSIWTMRPKPKMTPAELVAKLREIGPPPGPPPQRQRIIFPKRRGL
jgi:antitoxin VapB